MARSRTPGVYLEDLCFDAQQAAEKAIKGVLLAQRIDSPYVHDLPRLLALLAPAGESLPQDVKEASRLTRFAFKTRYPEFGEAVTEDDYLIAVTIEDSVVAWAETRVCAELSAREDAGEGGGSDPSSVPGR